MARPIEVKAKTLNIAAQKVAGELGRLMIRTGADPEIVRKELGAIGKLIRGEKVVEELDHPIHCERSRIKAGGLTMESIRIHDTTWGFEVKILSNEPANASGKK
jgi:hypothetical protein